MTDRERFALKNAAASCAMEGLVMSDEQLKTAERILDGDMTLEEFFKSLQSVQGRV